MKQKFLTFIIYYFISETEKLYIETKQALKVCKRIKQGQKMRLNA